MAEYYVTLKIHCTTSVIKDKLYKRYGWLNVVSNDEINSNNNYDKEIIQKNKLHFITKNSSRLVFCVSRKNLVDKSCLSNSVSTHYDN